MYLNCEESGADPGFCKGGDTQVKVQSTLHEMQSLNFLGGGMFHKEI